MEKTKLVEVDKEEEWKVEKVLNKGIMQECVKHFVHWKGFIVEYNS